jgi:N4-gp56 family major capsid protein
MATQVSSDFSGGSINAHIAEELLELAKRAVVFQQLGSKAKMPAGEGKTFQFNRYNRLALPRVALTEGTDPSSSSMSLTTVSATADQWGAYIELSDVAILTIKHPLLKVAIELLGYQAAELVDREIINVLLAGTSVSFGGAITVRSSLATASTDSLSDSVVQKAVARLRNRGAHPYEGSHYVGVLDPSMEQDVSQSSNSAFTSAASYSNIKALFNGEIGIWRGVRWMTSNFIPVLEGLAAGSYTSPASPAGTFTTANYRVSTAYYDANTGLLVGLTQNDNVAFTNLDSLAGTTPNDSDYVYKIFVSAAAAGATAAMYVGSETTYGTGFIPHNTAFSIVAPPSSGTSIAGSDIPGSGKKVHFGWIFGKQAYCTVDLQNLQVMVSKPEATTDNPLLLRRTVGYKMMFKPVIQNNDFMERIEVLSQFE